MFYRVTTTDFDNETSVIEFRKTVNGIKLFKASSIYFIGTLFRSREAALIAMGFAHHEISFRSNTYKIEEFNGSIEGVEFENDELEAVEHFENLAK